MKGKNKEKRIPDAELNEEKVDGLQNSTVNGDGHHVPDDKLEEPLNTDVKVETDKAVPIDNNDDDGA